MDAILFVQSFPMKNGKDGIELVWVPKPLERLCLGKTSQQCASMDYCIRTTIATSACAATSAVPLSRLPSYPPGMTPRRQLSVMLMYLSPDKFANLQQFFHSAPRASLERLSLSARVKARVRLTRTPDDDSLEVLEILAVAPF